MEASDYQWPNWCKNFPLICFSSPIYAYIFRVLSYTLLDFWYANCVRNSDRAVMAKISCKVCIFYLYFDWINPATWSKREFREVYYCSLRGLAKKNQIWLITTQKRELESNLTISETHVLNHSFMPKKKKGNFFPDGNSRGTLLARAALNHRVPFSDAMFSKNVP